MIEPVVGLLLGSGTTPPLTPSSDEARRQLRDELARPGYVDRNVVQRLLDAIGRAIGGGVGSAGGSSPIVFVMVALVVVALVAVVVLLASRARRTARATRERAAVLLGDQVSAAALRSRAEEALAQGRYADAVVDGFRSLARRQVERGRLDDAPGTTAREVARVLEEEFPDRGAELERCAELFDAVLYGDRVPTHEQAASVLALESGLAVAR